MTETKYTPTREEKIQTKKEANDVMMKAAYATRFRNIEIMILQIQTGIEEAPEELSWGMLNMMKTIENNLNEASNLVAGMNS